ncbi:MAG: hypothetical protein KME31_10285 [Tolypothrix carrinoi HA7290-LM1]|nr:hypothetical protein [Tolypothrix carrinoi HA7290-LM1]
MFITTALMLVAIALSILTIASTLVAIALSVVTTANRIVLKRLLMTLF